MNRRKRRWLLSDDRGIMTMKAPERGLFLFRSEGNAWFESMWHLTHFCDFLARFSDTGSEFWGGFGQGEASPCAAIAVGNTPLPSRHEAWQVTRSAWLWMRAATFA